MVSYSSHSSSTQVGDVYICTFKVLIVSGTVISKNAPKPRSVLNPPPPPTDPDHVADVGI